MCVRACLSVVDRRTCCCCCELPYLACQPKSQREAASHRERPTLVALRPVTTHSQAAELCALVFLFSFFFFFVSLSLSGPFFFHFAFCILVL